MSEVETATIRELIMLLARMEAAARDAVRAGATADVVELAESQRLVVAALRRHRGL